MTEEKQPSNTTPKEQLNIRIERWQTVVDILDDKRKVWRFAIIIIVIGLTLFAGITFIVLQLKRSFTYSDITTNIFGTTTITDEQKSVSYFLFNTAELWANSGIEVKKGDVISVHASGSGFTAIHHLYDDAEKNKKTDGFFDSEGDLMEENTPRDILRRQFRLFPNFKNSALIMQVVSDSCNRVPPYNSNNFYFIGKQRENILIQQDGTLHFAINDIVLEKNIIVEMMIANFAVWVHQDSSKQIEDIWNKNYNISADIIAKKQNDSYLISYLINRDKLQESIIIDGGIKLSYTKIDSAYHEAFKNATLYNKLLKDSTTFQFGEYYNDSIKKIDTTTHKTEMDYYYENDYYQAWFDDNIGSFLILVEKDNAKGK
ncbi:MAG: hypothetical protein IJS05_04485 [Paludibacteraceae bacterium]|nr:hypothetical protein [Paludibacteraceae bacterium]